MVVRDFDRALERATAADAALSRGENWGVLHGVPITVKENNDEEAEWINRKLIRLISLLQGC